MWRHTQAVKCMLKGDFTTYPALICPLCNGYQGLSGNGAIKKRYREEEEERHGGRRKREGKIEKGEAEARRMKKDGGEVRVREEERKGKTMEQRVTVKT